MRPPSPVALRARARTALQWGVKAAAAGIDARRGVPPGVVILLYHQVGGARPGSVNLPVARFEQQIATLAATRRVLSLDEALVHLGAPTARAGADDVDPGDPAVQPPGASAAVDAPAATSAAASPVVLTFDDGTADFVTNALPVLHRHGLPATLYVATRWVEEQRSFWDDGTVLSWAALREVRDAGSVTIGAHSHGHLGFDREPPEVLDDDLQRCCGLLQEHLGVTAAHFAYPGARPPHPAAEALVRRRFRSAALAGTRPNPVGATDPHRLARSPVQVADGMRWFRRKAAGGLAAEAALRDGRRRVRDRVARR